MEKNNYHNLQLEEQRYLEKLKADLPDEFREEQQPSYMEVLNKVGIRLPYDLLPVGVIKHHPLDFLVEEVLKNGSIADITYKNPEMPNQQKTPFLEMTIVKSGVSTNDVVRELANILKIPETKFSYSGIKDSRAMTSQRLNISGIDAAIITDVKIGNYFIKDISYTSSQLGPGQINGNRFTIFVRTNGQIEESFIHPRLEDLAKNGFWNFYWSQRFGTRLLSHFWGECILKNNHEKLLRSYFGESGPHDSIFFKKLRNEANKNFGDWNHLYELFKPFPFSMRHELILLDYLKKYSSDYVGALRTIPDQVKFWTYAYASNLANKMLSSYIETKTAPPTKIPLLLSNNLKERELYFEYLKKDGITINFNTGRFDFIRMVSRSIDTKIKPKIHKYLILPEGVILEFDLPKGAYATTFLSHIFELTFNRNLSWIKGNIYDLKEALGYPPISESIERLNALNVENTDDNVNE